MSVNNANPRTPLSGHLPVWNSTGSTISANRVVKYDASNLVSSSKSPGVALPGATTDVVAGATVADIADGKPGSLQVDGIIALVSAAAINAGDVLSPAATLGRVQTRAASTDSVVGIALETASGAAETILVRLMLSAP